MKNKIIKILEKPKVIIPTILAIALVVGFFVYKFVGLTPKVAIDFQDINNSSVASDSFQNFKDGEQVNLAFPKGGRVNEVNIKAGDFVHKGQVLASLAFVDAQGAVSQATGALEIAKANYQKILNGATGTDIDILKATVSKAQVNLDKTKSTQETLVANAYNNLLNSTPEAVPDGAVNDYTAPIITGNYSKGVEGKINISLYYTGNGSSFSATGIVNGGGTVNTTTPQPIGDSGLYIKLPSNTSMNVNNWVIEIPNKKAPNYLLNYNAYQSALSAQSQAVSLASADLEQAQANLTAKQSAARPEDVAIAKAQVDSATGALQVAQGAYNNNFIYAPADGVITVVNIQNGEIASVNQTVIGMIVKLKNN